MTNDEIIRRLLKFVRYEKGVLQISTEQNQWIDLSSWKVEQNKFSVYRLDLIDWADQFVKLRDYLYRTFYLIGRTDLSPVDENTPPPDLLIPPLPTLDRPELNNKALLPPATPNPNKDGSQIVEQDTIRFSLSPGKYFLTGDMEGDNPIYQFFSEHLLTDETDNTKSDGRRWTDSIQRGYDTEDQIIRFYLNPYPDLAQTITYQLIIQLDAYKIPFQLKYYDPNVEEVLTYCDQIVLYVPQRQFALVAWILFRIYNQYQQFLRSRLPLFVKPLLPLQGIGFAEEPVADESFGENRCGHIAHAVIKWAAGSSTDTSAYPPADQMIADIKSQQNNEDLTKFHLNPGSFYPYDFDIFKPIPAQPRQDSSSPYLKGAMAIANFLAREVAWISPKQCTWMVAHEVDSNPVYGPISNDWEKGFLGPLLFLHTLNKYVNDPLYAYILTCALPKTDLRRELAKTDPSIRDGLLNVYDYMEKSSCSFRRWFRNKMYSSNLEPVDKRSIIQYLSNLSITQESLQIHKGPSRGQKMYMSLLCAIKKSNQASTPLPKEFWEILQSIYTNSHAFITNVKGWNDFFPGMNGLALVGFSYLLAYDPRFPPIPVGNLSKECESTP